MSTLISLIPDIDVLVALAPEELAEVLLRLVHERMQHNNLVHLQSIVSDIHGNPGANDGYPQNRKREMPNLRSQRRGTGYRSKAF